MTSIKRGARSYYSDTDYRRDGIIGLIDNANNTLSIPVPTEEDAGKVLSVSSEGDYILNNVSGSGVRYIEIDLSGTTASLPEGVTFEEVYDLIQSGVEVKFTVGARIHLITAVQSTGIRAHWFSDFDLFNMDVSVINISSDGTGTVQTNTFSGY